MTGQDKVRERLEGLGETIGDSLRDMRDVQAARDYLLAALTAVLEQITGATDRIPVERETAKSARNLGERYYAEGLVDGCELAVNTIFNSLAAGLGVTP